MTDAERPEEGIPLVLEQVGYHSMPPLPQRLIFTVSLSVHPHLAEHD